MPFRAAALSLTLLLFATAVAEAGVGTTGADFLLIPPGARPAARSRPAGRGDSTVGGAWERPATRTEAVAGSAMTSAVAMRRAERPSGKTG